MVILTRGQTMFCQIPLMAAQKQPKRSPMAQWLKKLRVEMGLKQTELSEELGYSRSLVGMIETDQTPPQDEFLRRVKERFPGAEEPPLGNVVEDVRYLGTKSHENNPAYVYMAYAGEVPSDDMPMDPTKCSKTMKAPTEFDGEGRYTTKVVGASGHPYLQQGDLTAWEKDFAPSPGLIVLARTDDIGPVAFAKVSYAAEGTTLQALREGESLPLGCRAIARLVGITFQYKRIRHKLDSESGFHPEDLIFRAEQK